MASNQIVVDTTFSEQNETRSSFGTDMPAILVERHDSFASFDLSSLITDIEWKSVSTWNEFEDFTTEDLQR